MHMIILDTETTGLPKPSAAGLLLQPHVIEFAAIKIDDSLKIVDKLEFICNPGIPLEPIITKITGLKDSDLVDKPAFGHYIHELNRFFWMADAVVAHNHEFDRQLVYFELLRLGCTDGFEGCNASRVCTVEATMHLHNRRLKLTELYEIAVGKPLAQTHRAMDDVMALYEVVKWIKAQGIPL